MEYDEIGDKQQITEEERKALLNFLYEKLNIAQLSASEQARFKAFYKVNTKLFQIAQFASEFEDVFNEMESVLPIIKNTPQAERYLYEKMQLEQQLREYRIELIKQNVQKEGNVLFVPFRDGIVDKGPIIVCLEQSPRIHELDLEIKGMILSLFSAAERQQRNLYIIPYSDRVKVHYTFEHGVVNMDDFISFILYKDKGHEVKISQALQFAIGIVREHAEYEEAHILLVTAGEPSDIHLLNEGKMRERIEDRLADLDLDVSVIALDNDHFCDEFFWFANKIYFASEYLRN